VVGPPPDDQGIGKAIPVQFHSYLSATDGGIPAPCRGPRSGRRRHHPGDGIARKNRAPRPRRRLGTVTGVTSLLRP
jgi:hypothetical protein